MVSTSNALLHGSLRLSSFTMLPATSHPTLHVLECGFHEHEDGSHVPDTDVAIFWFICFCTFMLLFVPFFN